MKPRKSFKSRIINNIKRHSVKYFFMAAVLESVGEICCAEEGLLTLAIFNQTAVIATSFAAGVRYVATTRPKPSHNIGNNASLSAATP